MTDPLTSVARKWRAASGADIAWAEWGGEYIAFHRPSGKTHLLNEVSAILLTRILIEPLGTNDIVRNLAESVAANGDADYEAEITAMLDRFEQLGLVERA